MATATVRIPEEKRDILKISEYRKKRNKRDTL